MAPPEHLDRIVLHIAGTDRPGITARVTEVIAHENARIVTMGQSALHGYLVLSLIVDVPQNSHALRRLLFAVEELGLRMEVNAFSEAKSGSLTPCPGLCVTVLGELADGRAVSAITKFIASRGMNLRDVRSLSEGSLSGLELITDAPKESATDKVALRALRGEILAMAPSLGVDLAVQRDDIFRRSKRLVCMDVDSTFVKGEFIDELGELAGVKPQVEEITARAMRGELDFKQALAARVALLEGLPMARARELCDRFELTPGADQLVRTLQKLGFRVGLVSGGFNFFVEMLKQRYSLDFTFANELEVKDDKLTGRVQGTIVDSERKAQLLKDMAHVYQVPLEQTVAVGDGANDMLMLQTAGLGIAYQAKPKLQEVADTSLNHHVGIDTLLYLMGYSESDLSSLSGC